MSVLYLGMDLFGRLGRTVFFAQRILCYWNKLPADVKCSESVASLKSRIDSFRLKGYRENRLGHFWELSYDFARVGYII